MTDHTRGVLYATLGSVIYGLSFMVTKDISSSLGVFTILGWRFILAFLFMEILRRSGLVSVQLTKDKFRDFLPITLLFPLAYFILETYGIALTTASESGMIIATIPLMTLLFSILITKLRPARNQTLGILMSLVGLVLSVLSAGFSLSFSLVGYLCLMGAVLSYSLYTIFVFEKKRITATEKTYLSILSSCVFFTVLGLLENLRVGSITTYVLALAEPAHLLPLLYLGILSSVGAFFLTLSAIQYLGASRAASFEGLTTFISILAGVVVLKESFGPLQIVSSGLIILGLLLANLTGQRQKAKGN